MPAHPVSPVTQARTCAFGPDVLRAAMRTTPEDFLVEEQLGFAASGQGEHLFLQIEKRLANTAWVAQQLARWAGVAEHAIGYAGLKDRHALTRQTFTVHLPGREAPDLESLAIEGVRVLAADRHQRKLPRGALRGNRFVLTLRQVEGERAAIDGRLTQITARGVPNWFGAQRFGRAGANVAAARAMFAGRRVSRQQRSIYLSAARSELFNRILAERVKSEAWDTAVSGDIFMLDGSHSVFGPVPLDAGLERRLAACDIHPTGALWGAGAPRCDAEALKVEMAVAAAAPELVEGLAKAGLRHERRALRLPVRELTWRWGERDLVLSFELPAGGYATAVLDALGPVRDAAVVERALDVALSPDGRGSAAGGAE